MSVNTSLSTLLAILKNVVFSMDIKDLTRHFFRHFFRQKILIDIQQIHVIIMVEYEIVVSKGTLMFKTLMFFSYSNDTIPLDFLWINC